MAEVTVETTDGGAESESTAETTTVEAVAETAKSEGAAEVSAENARSAATEVKYGVEDANRSAETSAQAALIAGQNATQAEMARNETLEAVNGLRAAFESLATRLAPPEPVTESAPAVVELQESEPKRVPFLQRKVNWGKKS